MKWLLVIAGGGLLFISCKNHYKPSPDEQFIRAGYTKRIFNLKNGIGEVSIYLHKEFDTFYVHSHHNDMSDDGPVYRFSSKKFYVFHDTNENWFFGKERPDSLYQLEIIQNDEPSIYGDSAYTNQRTHQILKGVSGETNGIQMVDTEINRREYLFSCYHPYPKENKIVANLNAETYVNGYDLRFNFKYSGNKQTDFYRFYNQACNSLSTLKIRGKVSKKYIPTDVKYVIYDLYSTSPGGTKIDYKLTRDSLFANRSGDYRYINDNKYRMKYTGVALNSNKCRKLQPIIDSLPSIFLNCNSDCANFGRGPAYFDHTWLYIEIHVDDRIENFTVDTDWQGVPEEVKKYTMMLIRLRSQI